MCVLVHFEEGGALYRSIDKVQACRSIRYSLVSASWRYKDSFLMNLCVRSNLGLDFIILWYLDFIILLYLQELRMIDLIISDFVNA